MKLNEEQLKTILEVAKETINNELYEGDDLHKNLLILINDINLYYKLYFSKEENIKVLIRNVEYNLKQAEDKITKVKNLLEGIIL